VISAAVKDALHKVASMRNTLSQTTADRSRREQRISEITQEQARIRENMARLSQTSDLYNSYVKELTQQENDLAALRKEIESLKDTETKQQRDLNDYILNLDVE
jgi:chromosome segregation ATPase